MVEHHTAGEPFRIVVEGGSPLRGHADMDGATDRVLDDPHDPLGTGFTLR